MKKAIICIDDERVILTSLKSQLKRNFGNDFIYEIAENAKEGFDLVEEHTLAGNKILLIISDWLMPEMKGDEFFMELNKKHPDIIKILLTGQATNEAIKRAYNTAGILKCLHKPWEEQYLIDTIQEAMQKLNTD